MELSCAIPYLQILAKQSNIIILTGHWLWPFELSKLDTIVPGYKGTGISDTRLHDQSALTRGCGGVGILWKKSFANQQRPIYRLGQNLCHSASHIFKLDVNGKCWRLIKEWYSDTSSVVRVNDRRSESFPVKRGVKQGSVLSPTLFIAVMDSLLSFL